MGWSRDGVIGDILDQYERHMHFLHVVRWDAGAGQCRPSPFRLTGSAPE